MTVEDLKEDILFECWHKSNDEVPTNKTILKAMEKYAEAYHQSRVNGIKTLEDETPTTKEITAFKLGWNTCKSKLLKQ